MQYFSWWLRGALIQAALAAGTRSTKGAFAARYRRVSYYAGGQRAVRDRDWKYLQIAGNEFLFDIVQDPRERANLKDRRKDIFDRLKSDWEAWNSMMLAERTRPVTHGNPGNFVADHYGVMNPK